MVLGGRVLGRLAVTRSVGDAGLKSGAGGRRVVDACPDVACAWLAASDAALVLACDGVWDVMTPDEAAADVRGTLAGATPGGGPPSGEAAAAHLAAEAIRRGSQDNVSVTVVVLGPALRHAAAVAAAEDRGSGTAGDAGGAGALRVAGRARAALQSGGVDVGGLQSGDALAALCLRDGGNGGGEGATLSLGSRAPGASNVTPERHGSPLRRGWGGGGRTDDGDDVIEDEADSPGPDGDADGLFAPDDSGGWLSPEQPRRDVVPDASRPAARPAVAPRRQPVPHGRTADDVNDAISALLATATTTSPTAGAASTARPAKPSSPKFRGRFGAPPSSPCAPAPADATAGPDDDALPRRRMPPPQPGPPAPAVGASVPHLLSISAGQRLGGSGAAGARAGFPAHGPGSSHESDSLSSFLRGTLSRSVDVRAPSDHSASPAADGRPRHVVRSARYASVDDDPDTAEQRHGRAGASAAGQGQGRSSSRRRVQGVAGGRGARAAGGAAAGRLVVEGLSAGGGAARVGRRGGARRRRPSPLRGRRGAGAGAGGGRGLAMAGAGAMGRQPRADASGLRIKTATSTSGVVRLRRSPITTPHLSAARPGPTTAARYGAGDRAADEIERLLARQTRR